MNKGEVYWVKIKEDGHVRTIKFKSLYEGYSSWVGICENEPFLVYDDGDRLFLVKTPCLAPSEPCCIARDAVNPLSYTDVFNLNMEKDEKWWEIYVDCFNRELVDRETDLRYFAGTDLGNGRDFSTNIHDMKTFREFLYKQIEELQQMASPLNGFKFEPRKVSHEPQLPDEVDLYNFFEKWQGKVVGLKEDNSHSRLCSYKTCFPYLDKFNIRELSVYLSHYDSFFSTEYYIGKKRYHAVKFKDRGTFLVSEKRYNELKAKKGK